MIREGLEYLVGLAAPSIHRDPEGREFSNRELNPVHVPLIEPLCVTTLAGFCDLCDHGFEAFDAAAANVVVGSFEHVSLIANRSDAWSRRIQYLACVLPDTTGFQFGQWMQHEPFIIGLQANFVPTEDLEYLLKIASNLGNERVRTSQDDGISQTVNLKAGIVLKSPDATVVRSRVTLAPYRTFREIKQPASDFVFRLKNLGEDAPPILALFEADGGKWKLDAMEEIGRYLRVRLGDAYTVVI